MHEPTWKGQRQLAQHLDKEYRSFPFLNDTPRQKVKMLGMDITTYFPGHCDRRVRVIL